MRPPAGTLRIMLTHLPRALMCSLLAMAGLLASCASRAAHTTGPAGEPAPRWAVALHGGAGTIDPDAPPELVAAYTASLRAALDDAAARLDRGEAAVDVAQAVVARLEEDPLFNAGVGAAFTAEGTHELDASIMDGATLRCGAVAGVTTVRSPIGLARLVMDRTRHVLLTGAGAESFATHMNVPRVPNGHFSTPRRREMWQQWRAEQQSGLDAHARALPIDQRASTVGCVALDVHGHLASATSTGGLTGKRWGRVGDSPIIGAGTYANAHAAVSCTGTGEEYIRHGVAKALADRVELLGEPIDQAAHHLVHRTLRPDDGGLIALDARGNIAMPFNTPGMYRASATDGGPRVVSIWSAPQP
jgi:beta-aspartyl-peptidase (threonine type)